MNEGACFCRQVGVMERIVCVNIYWYLLSMIPRVD